MKIVVNKEFGKALNKLKGFTGKVIPATTCVLVDADESIVFRAYGDDASVQWRSMNEEWEIEETGSALLEPKTIVPILNRLKKEDRAVIEAKEGTVRVKVGKTKLNLQMPADPEEFPAMKDDPGQEIEIVDSVFEAFRKAGYAAGKSEARPILKGINVSFKPGNGLQAVSTDSYRLVQYEAACQGGTEHLANVTFLPPGGEVTDLLDGTETLRMGITSSHIVFRTEDKTVRLRLLADKYPDTDRLIPQEGQIFTTSKETMLAAVKGARMISETGTIEIQHAELKLTAKNETGIYEEEIEIKDGFEMKMALNLKYLEDTLSMITDEEIAIMCKGANMPIVIRPLGKEDELHLILPVRLAD